MHATFRHDQPTGENSPIRGTFYLSHEPPARGSIASALPKVLAIMVAFTVVRNVVAAMRHHRGSSGRSRRRDAIAQLHRELHAADTAAHPDDSTA